MKFPFLLVTCLSIVSTMAQSTFPYDSAHHTVSYSQSHKLATKVKTKDVYDATLVWFGDSARFTRRNAEVPVSADKTKILKAKDEIENQYNNSRPLQIQDPNGGKIQGMGLIKYYGGSGSIKLLYLKYDLNVKLKADNVSITVSNMRYFHFTPAYKETPVYNFSGGKPCESSGTMDYLIGCEGTPDEMKKLAVYCNKEINAQLSAFREMLRQKKFLNEAPPAKAIPKPAAKPTAVKKK